MGRRKIIMETAKMGIFELAPEITSEEMKAIFFDAKALRVPNYKLYQLNTKGQRYYYTIGNDGLPTFYPSVTTILSAVMPSNPFLNKWKADMGWEEANAYTQERASYGTYMHGAIEQLLVARTYDLDLLKVDLAKYIEREQLPTSFINYAEDLKRDILSFAQFVKDYDVIPLCIEESLYSSKGYAGMIDLVANMRVYTFDEMAKAKEKKGDKWTEKDEEKYNARHIVMIDFKSSRKGFYESHIVQLHLYRDMWAENFPDIPIDALYNWAPKEWVKSPTYNFKDQTDAINPDLPSSLLWQYQLRQTELKSVTLVHGMIDLGGDLGNNYQTLTLDELVQTKNTDKEEDDDDELFKL